MKALTAEQKTFYDENGYLVREGVLAGAQIDALDQEIQGLHERMAENPADGIHISWEEQQDLNAPRRILQLMHSELVSPTLNTILRSDSTLDVVEDLIGPNVSLYHSKLLMKAAGAGTAIPWHQDYAYWKSEGNQPLMINCQIAIDESTPENGCLEFVPGSHLWGLQEHEREQRAFGVALPGRHQPRADAVAVPLRPGDGVFFNSLVIHGSRANTSEHDRRMNTFAYNVTGNNPDQCREILRGKN